MSEIAAAAELSRNSLYSMFESKERLYQEVISTTAGAIRDAVEQRAFQLADPGEQLLSIIDLLFACYQENQELLRIYWRGTQGPPWKIREAMGESSLQLFQSFTGWVVEVATRGERAGYLRGLDAETVGVSLVGTVTTTAGHWIEQTPERPLSQPAAEVRAVFEHLLGSGANA